MKKGISPVVATALLLVVAVVFVVGMQTWFEIQQNELGYKEVQDIRSYEEVGEEDEMSKYPKVYVFDKFMEAGNYYIKSDNDLIYIVDRNDPLPIYNKMRPGEYYYVDTWGNSDYKIFDVYPVK